MLPAREQGFLISAGSLLGVSQVMVLIAQSWGQSSGARVTSAAPIPAWPWGHTTSWNTLQWVHLHHMDWEGAGVLGTAVVMALPRLSLLPTSGSLGVLAMGPLWAPILASLFPGGQGQCSSVSGSTHEARSRASVLQEERGQQSGIF